MEREREREWGRWFGTVPEISSRSMPWSTVPMNRRSPETQERESDNSYLRLGAKEGGKVKRGREGISHVADIILVSSVSIQRTLGLLVPKKNRRWDEMRRGGGIQEAMNKPNFFPSNMTSMPLFRAALKSSNPAMSAWVSRPPLRIMNFPWRQ
jgi:hypothetical protein